MTTNPNLGRPKTGEALADWSDVEDAANRRRELKRIQRREKLDELVPDRICPSCSRVFLESKAWVCGTNSAVCRSCFAQRGYLKGSEIYMRATRHVVIENLVARAIVAYVCDPEVLVAARESASLSQLGMAKLCAWSRGYQRELERSATRISLANMCKLQSVLREHGVEIVVPGGVR